MADEFVKLSDLEWPQVLGLWKSITKGEKFCPVPASKFSELVTMHYNGEINRQSFRIVLDDLLMHYAIKDIMGICSHA